MVEEDKRPTGGEERYGGTKRESNRQCKVPGETRLGAGLQEEGRRTERARQQS